MMTIRPGVWRPSIVIPWSLLVGMCIAAVVIWPGQAAGAVTALLLIGLIAWVAVRPIRLEITESVVRSRQGRRRGPDEQVSRSEIRAIHYFPHVIIFVNSDRGPIMRTRPEWTLRQMRTVADVLGVRLYDNRHWSRLWPVRVGRLVYDPRQETKTPRN
jgi:hypothetical protein